MDFPRKTYRRCKSARAAGCDFLIGHANEDVRVAPHIRGALRGKGWYMPKNIHLRDGFPTIVCLCGSTRFGDAYRDAMREETLAGRIVLTVGLLGHAEGIDMGGPVKAALDELHLRKIDLADEILVLNVGGYVGESTRREIAYARSRGKTIRSLHPLEEQS